MIDESLLLQYIIRLYICGYQDDVGTLPTQSTTSHRLEELIRHTDAWHNLDWTESRLLVPPPEIYDLSDGLYAAITDRVITCVQLPSRISGTEARTWSFENDFSPVEIALDPSQDLLVLVEM